MELVPSEEKAKKLTGQLETTTSVPSGADHEGAKIPTRYVSGRRIFVVDGDAIVKPMKSLLPQYSYA